MPKLPKRLPYEVAVACLIMLGSCDTDRQPKLMTREEVADIAEDQCDSAVANNDKVRDLESRVSELETKLNN